MKIGLDLRFIDDDLYSSYVLELTKGIIENNYDDNFVIYTNKNLKGFNYKSTTIKNIGIKNNSISEQISYNKILKNDQNSLMIFFNHYKPILYKGEYYLLIPSLKDIYYNNYSNYIKKYYNIYLLEKNLKNASKIICFDKKTSLALTEKFNIKEEKIHFINGFFPKKDILTNIEYVEIDIRIKYDLKNDYYIYSGGEGIEKNYEKLIKVFHKFKKENIDIDLVILGQTISRNISLRKLILELEMQKNIHFISEIKEAEKILFYKNALGTIFPSLYEPFPFRLTEPLYFHNNILANNLENIKSIFGENITYFSGISVNDIYKTIKNDLTKNKKNINYNQIITNVNKEKSIAQLLTLIK